MSEPADDVMFAEAWPWRFPLTIQILDAVTREVVHVIEVEGPGVVQVPGRNVTNGGKPVAVRVLYADGTTEEAEE